MDNEKELEFLKEQKQDIIEMYKAVPGVYITEELLDIAIGCIDNGIFNQELADKLLWEKLSIFPNEYFANTTLNAILDSVSLLCFRGNCKSDIQTEKSRYEQVEISDPIQLCEFLVNTGKFDPFKFARENNISIPKRVKYIVSECEVDGDDEDYAQAEYENSKEWGEIVEKYNESRKKKRKIRFGQPL